MPQMMKSNVIRCSRSCENTEGHGITVFTTSNTDGRSRDKKFCCYYCGKEKSSMEHIYQQHKMKKLWLNSLQLKTKQKGQD